LSIQTFVGRVQATPILIVFISSTGLPDNKIRFVPAEQVDQIQPNRTIRLVDGPSINEGVVQVRESLVVL
jgi:hypothetical protein